MTTSGKTVALLIDADNQIKYAKQIIQFCNRYGTLRIKKAYGDWKKLPLSTHVQTLHELSVKKVQQNRVAKDASDFKLAMDVALMLEKKEADIYFIVSSDTHFATVCQEIRQKGAKVIGIGTKEQPSDILRRFCNEYHNIEDIIRQVVSVKKLNESTHKTASIPKTKPANIITQKTMQAPLNAATPKFKPRAMLNILIQAYQNTPQENGKAHLSQVRETLRQQDKYFELRFAGKKLSAWFRDFSDDFVVEEYHVRMK